MEFTRAFKLGRHPRPVGRAIARQRIGDAPSFASIGTGRLPDLAPGEGRVAVISDVHANLPALEAVLAAIDEAGIEQIWCLGDIVGYGASPVQCLRLVRERCGLVLGGNHDLAAVGDESLEQFGYHARPGVEHAQRELAAAADGEELHEWLALRLTEVADARRSGGFDLTNEADLVHHQMDALRMSAVVAAHAAPAPWDSVWDYVGAGVDPAEVLEQLHQPLVLVGHSHVQFAWTADGMHRAAGEPVQLGDGAVVNPGSVGQPRDGDPDAAWLELDQGGGTVTMHRTPYDVDAAVAAIEAAGMPAGNAERLRDGL